MTRRFVLSLVLAAGVVPSAPAAAQVPGTGTITGPAPPPPAAQPGRASLALRGGLSTRAARYVARGQTVAVSGVVRPYVAGQTILVEVLRRGRVVSRQRVAIRRRGSRGVYSARITFRRRGSLRVRARHEATAEQKAFRTGSKGVRVVVWRAGGGARGTKVLLLQRGLRKLRYAVPVSGSFGAGTARAVTAFRKVNGMGRTGYASAAVYSRVLSGLGEFRLRYPGAGRHVEFDWSRQVLVLADNGRPWRTYHASSGKPSTPTVFGAFRFYRKQRGTNSHGMVHSSYFIGGYAIHGYASVPSYPASHGCIRVPIPNAWEIFTHISLGERIFVYR